MKGAPDSSTRGARASVRTSAVVNLLAVAGSAVAGLLATATMARLMDPAAFGLVSIALLVANAASILEGMRPVVVLEVNRGVLRWEDVFFATHMLARCLGGVAATLTLVGGLFIGRLGLDPIQTCAFAASLACYFLSTTYWSLLDADGNTAVTGAARGGMWIMVYGLFAGLAAWHAATTTYFLVLLAANGAVLFFLRQRLRSYRRVPRARLPTLPAARALYRAALNNISFNVAAVTLGSADRLAVAGLLGYAAVGRYSAMYDIATKPIALVRALASVIYPAAVHSRFGGGEFERQWRVVTIAIMVLSTVAAVIAVLLREWLVGLVLGARYAAGADVFGVVVGAFWASAVGYCANIYLYTTGDFATPARVYAVVAAIMLLALVPVISVFGMIGAACVYAATRLVDVTMLMIVLRRMSLPWVSAQGALNTAVMTAAFVCAWHGWVAATCATLGLLLTISVARVLALRQ